MMEVYKRYVDELKQDTSVDELSLKEKALFLPGIKAKWVSRLIQHKNSLNKLEKQRTKLFDNVADKIKEESPIKIHNAIIKEKIESSPEFKEFLEQVQQEKLTIDFLERVEKIFSSMSFDISNIVKIVQLETT